jgi:pyruvate,water dikinase
MDIEWAKDGKTGELFILQARPETVHSVKRRDLLQIYRLEERGERLLEGKSVGEMIGQGRARVIKDVHHLDEFQEGEVLVTDKTDPDWEPIMKKTAAIVTNRGGRTSHAAIVSRELGIPAVVGTERATEVLGDGEEITVSSAEGDSGFVYRGLMKFSVQEVDLGPRARTKIMPTSPIRRVFVCRLSQRWRRSGAGGLSSATPSDPPHGVIATTPGRSGSKAEIAQLTAGYADKSQYFVDKLAEGVGMIAAAFYPKDVIVRLSDFKSNEYANLIGGKEFEPTEENPMLGFRGASRYYDDRYREGFPECSR